MTGCRDALRTGVVALIVVLTVLLSARPAGAHAALLGTDPPTGGVVDEAPTRVELRFTEPVRVAPDGIRVFDPTAERVDAADATADGPLVRVSLDGSVPDAAYVVSWRVTSEDGHPIDGSFVFAVGDASVADAAAGVGAASGDGVWDVAGWAARALAAGGGLTAVGLALAGLTGVGSGAVFDRARKVATLVGVAGLVLVLPVQAALQTGAGAGALGRDGALADALAGGIGWSVLVGGAGLCVLGVSRSGPWWWAAIAAVGVGAALTGHTRSTDPVWATVLVDSLHVLAAAAWVGALVALLLTARTRGPGPFAAPAVRLAVGGVATAAVAGVVLAWSQVRSVDALVTTSYGALLASKVVVVAVAVGIGRWNRRRGGTRALVLEVVLAAVVVGLTAALVQRVPAREEVGEEVPTVAIGRFDGGSVEVGLDGSTSGALRLRFVDASGAPDDRWTEVVARLSLPAVGISRLRAEGFREDVAEWRTDPVDISVAGNWNIQVFAGADDGTVVSTTVSLRLE